MKKLLLVLLFVPVVAVACDKGESEWNGGCVVDLKPQIAEPVKPSDEKLPEGKMPSYQREDVKIVDAPSMVDEDNKNDLDKRLAEAQGKQAAGIKPK